MSETDFFKARSNLKFSQGLRDSLLAPQGMAQPDFGALQMQQEPIAPEMPPSFPRAQSPQLSQMAKPLTNLMSSSIPTIDSFQPRLPITQQAKGMFQKARDFIFPKPASEQESLDMGLIPATLPSGAKTNLDPFGLTGSVAKRGADVTLKSLKALANEVKTPQVAKQYLLDLANRGELKQAERDLLRSTIDELDDDLVDVKDFAKRVKTELLPLTRKGAEQEMRYMSGDGSERIVRENRYENVVLPDELRGPVANYNEHIYESPIKTSAGSVHFQDASPNYFAHTRIEDLPTGSNKIFDEARARGLDDDEAMELVKKTGGSGSTRRVIEIQSDLFQKGRLENSVETGKGLAVTDDIRPEYNRLQDQANEIMQRDMGTGARAQELRQVQQQINDLLTGSKTNTARKTQREAELAKLEPYRNTWWERIVREEVKQAAKDGKTKLQFPTGETAMKIEGLGDTTKWAFFKDQLSNEYEYLTPNNMKVGQEVTNANAAAVSEKDYWIITDVLGDGKFKAVPKRILDEFEQLHPDSRAYRGYGGEGGKEEYVRAYQEEFDISGKVDTNNPIYRFYEKDVQKYLMKKYGGKVVTDPQGVSWIEFDIPKEAGKAPVEAFGALPLLNDDEE